MIRAIVLVVADAGKKWTVLRAVFLNVFYYRLDTELKNFIIAALVFVGSIFVYFLYSIYFCQTSETVGVF